MKKIVLLTLLFSVSFMALSQKEDSLVIRKFSDDILKNGKAYENLYYLSKKIGARLSGSTNAQKAVEATMKMLKDAGADTVYLQPCMVPHWVRGEKERGIIHWGNSKKALQVCALGMSVGTNAEGIKAEVIEVANFDELKRLGTNKVKGKIVFFNYPMRPELVYNGYGDAVRYRGAGPVEAAKLGAAGVMIRSVTHALDYNPHTGSTRYDSAVQKIPAMACSTMDAEWLHDLLKKEIKVEMYMKMNCEQLPDAQSYNVVGEIWGSEFPSEIITTGGHLDSWDLGEGAHDDGSGCVQSIEVIRVLKAMGIKPKRTIRAVMFMNEENGTRGAAKYAELATANKENHIFAIESDAGGFGVISLGIDGSPAQELKIRSWLPLFKPYGILDMPDGGGGADIGPLKKLGTVMCGVNPGSQRYFDHHHAPNDVFEAVNKRELEMGAVGMTAIIYLVDKYGL
ncbi:MAG TPA: M20/M25/M40 family metallo-hydrolase [Chitinophagaceae bacterium]|nr:M20/M25/M40 family metallo-hydrolase [Chitinophagaceae bacterium]